MTGKLVAFPNQITEVGLLYRLVVETQLIRPDFTEQDAANGRINYLLVGVAKNSFTAEIRVQQTDAVVRLQGTITVGKDRLDLGAEQRKRLQIGRQRFARLGSDVIATQRNILGGGDDRFAGRRRKDVIGRHHQQTRFQLGLDGQRNVNGHLVAVKVSVVSGTNQRMNPDGFAFDQLRFESLNGQPMQRRGTIQKNRMAFGDLFQHVPNFAGLAFDHLLGAAHSVHIAELFQAADDERFEQDESHLFRKTALVELQFRTDHDDGTARVIDALAKQVLTETSALALEHVAQRFQRAIARTGHRAAMPTIVKQGVHCFLQHAFLVPDDDFRGLELQQGAQTVVPVDDAAV